MSSIEIVNNDIYYNQNDKYHRTHGPAVIINHGSTGFVYNDSYIRRIGPYMINNKCLSYNTRKGAPDFISLNILSYSKTSNVISIDRSSIIFINRSYDINKIQ